MAETKAAEHVENVDRKHTSRVRDPKCSADHSSRHYTVKQDRAFLFNRPIKTTTDAALLVVTEETEKTAENSELVKATKLVLITQQMLSKQFLNNKKLENFSLTIALSNQSDADAKQEEIQMNHAIDLSIKEQQERNKNSKVPVFLSQDPEDDRSLIVCDQKAKLVRFFYPTL